MKRLYALGLWLVVTGVLCAMGATIATSASAIVPGLGSCHHVGVPYGEQEESRCVTAEKKGAYQWCWFAVKYAPTSPCYELAFEVARSYWFSNSVTFFSAKAEVEVSCERFQAEGSYTASGDTIEKALLDGCESRGVSCQSPGAEKGEIFPGPLEGALGIINAERGEVGLRLSAPSGLAFMCGETSFEVRGSVIGKTIADESVWELPITYEAENGEQIPDRFEGGTKATLEASINKEPYEEIGFQAKITQEAKEPVEILCSGSLEETSRPEPCA